MREMIGQTIDRYQIAALLHEDRIASIYKAYDPKFDRAVTIHLTSEPQQMEYIIQAARTILSWRHAGLARLYDFGTFDEQIYAVQEFIASASLQDIQTEMRQTDCWVSLGESVLLVKELCLALEFAHQRSIVHGDLYPGNVLFKSESAEDLPYQPVLIRTGLVKPGTNLSPPTYRSPEATRGGRLEKTADIYSIGAILYELTTGQPPTPQAQVSSGPAQVLPPHLLHSELPEGLEKIILKALSPNPDDRFPDANSFAANLNQIQSQTTNLHNAPSGFSRTCQLTQFIEQNGEEPEQQGSERSFTAPGALPSLPTIDITLDTVFVLMPDKSVRSFKMKVGGLTIGRSKENDIALDLPGISRNHARIDFDGQNYLVHDLHSLNGTFLEQKRLPPGKAQTWLPGENMRIGEAWMRIERQAQTRTTQAVVSRDLPTHPGRSLPETDEVFVGPNGNPIESTQVLRSPGLGWVGVHSESLNVSVTPGASLDIPILLFNRGPANDTFLVTILGIPLDWVPNPPQPVRVPSNAQREARITIRPPRSPLVKAGRYGVVFRVASQNSPNQSVELRVTLTVAAFSLFASELRPSQIRSGENGQVYVHNRGNLPESFTVIWEDRTQTLVFDPPQVKVNLQVGKSAVIEFHPSLLRPRLLGPEMAQPFRTHISSQGGQVETHSGEYLSRGIVPSWAPIALVVLTVILACFVCVFVNQVTFPIRRADQTAEAGKTQLALVTETAVSNRTATSQSLEGANLATLQAATATAAWLALDQDQDGLSNSLEGIAGTRPDIPDTDQDELSDGVEVLTWKTNPLVTDTDGDGLRDGVEVDRGTNPLQRDTDRDGLNDATDPDPLNAPTRTPIIFLPTATIRPPITSTSTHTSTPTLSPTPPSTDLSISVSNGQNTSIPGTNTSFTIVINNKGPAAVINAQVIDQFPATLTNVTWVCTTSPGSRCSTPNGIGNVNALIDLVFGGTATITANGRIAPNASSQLSNTARVVTPGGIIELNPADNQSTDTDTLTPHAALSLSKTDELESVFPGQGVSYAIIVFNNGPSTVNGITVVDDFPSQLNNATWTCDATTGSSCATTGTQNGNINNQVNLNPGGTTTFNVSATVRDSATGTISNTASITSPVDPGTNNKSATDTTTIIPQANLLVEVSAPTTVTAGSPITYTITITNSGPSQATGITLTNSITTTATYMDSDPDAPDCEIDGDELRCELGNLASSDTLQVIIIVSAPLTPGPFPNQVEVRANEQDPNLVNNDETTTVNAT